MKSVISFILLTFAISWSAWGAAIATGSDAAGWRIAGTFGPTVAALILCGRAGRAETGRLLSGFLRLRAPAHIYAFALFSTAAVGFAALAIDGLLGGSPDIALSARPAMIPVMFAWVLLFSVAGEETGWRGYLLARLLERTGPVRAGLAVGFAWGAWHLPLWLLPGNFHAAIPPAPFLVQILAMSILHTWLWSRSGDSLFIAHLFHAASNTTLGILPLLPGEGADSPRPLAIAAGLAAILACIVALRLARGTGTTGRAA
ncbi:CPBP family intramembrane glutamic endopeptidase [Oricola thermophila]|uniref:CPBP family intramembrane metalloprotease n=1 Tax=Oricola thermophila TaxID=2742145 RepID=A0A6N1VLW9_9HYPH|nr:CPBP family intramembrane glutamic endopeptidase [Oricola thermophila]QKV20422.1 CPBP family intramembrane metalloprotease [Oricola thermophila]